MLLFPISSFPNNGRRDQRILQSAHRSLVPPPPDRARIPPFRSRSSRTANQNAIRGALPSETWLGAVPLRAPRPLNAPFRPPLHSRSPTFRPKHISIRSLATSNVSTSYNSREGSQRSLYVCSVGKPFPVINATAFAAHANGSFCISTGENRIG